MKKTEANELLKEALTSISGRIKPGSTMGDVPHICESAEESLIKLVKNDEQYVETVREFFSGVNGEDEGIVLLYVGAIIGFIMGCDFTINFSNFE